MAGPYDLTKSNANHPAFKGSVAVRKRSRVFHAASQNLAQNEVANLLTIPAGTYVMAVVCEVLTVDANAGTFDVGDVSTVGGYVLAANQAVLGITDTTWAGTLGGTGAAGDPVVVTGYSAGKFYSAAGTIDLKALGASGMTTAVIRVTALTIDMNERNA